jgi:hypothetical protein
VATALHAELAGFDQMLSRNSEALENITRDSLPYTRSSTIGSRLPAYAPEDWPARSRYNKQHCGRLPHDGSIF